MVQYCKDVLQSSARKDVVRSQPSLYPKLSAFYMYVLNTCMHTIFIIMYLLLGFLHPVSF